MSTQDAPEIPKGPPPHWLTGNRDDLIGGYQHMKKLVKEYGGFFSVVVPAKKPQLFGGQGPTFLCADPELVAEIVSQPDVFQKITFKYSQFRTGANASNDGLFTSDDDEPIWHIAHRILRAAFSQKGMRIYFDQMKEATDILCKKMEEYEGESDKEEEDKLCELHPLMSKFTFEVINKVGFGLDTGAITGSNEWLERFEQISDMRDELKPFQTSLFGNLMPKKHQLTASMSALQQKNRTYIEKLIQDKACRLARGETQARPDMMMLMLTTSDPVTGQKLPHSNIFNQCQTFLVAGHDSTSTALTMLLYHLALHPTAMAKVHTEIMRVLGPLPEGADATAGITWERLAQLDYCTQAIKENLRLFPPASAFIKSSPRDRDVTLGPYKIPKGSDILTSIWGLHHNPRVWKNPEKFDPDRFSPEESAKRKSHAWLPFSFGPRACLGQQLSLLEQKIALAAIVRKFHVVVDPSTQLRITQPLFMNPQGIFIRLERRSQRCGVPSPEGDLLLVPTGVPSTPVGGGGTDPQVKGEAGSPQQTRKIECLKDKTVQILYGSNMGTARETAEDLEGRLASVGFSVECGGMDECLASGADASSFPRKDQGALVVVTSTYNGHPPDNARKFKSWLQELDASAKPLKDVSLFVFGCGNRQWERTFQHFPKMVRGRMEELGAVVPEGGFGFGDADSDLEAQTEEWMARTLKSLVSAFAGEEAGLDLVEKTPATRFPLYETETVVELTKEEVLKRWKTDGLFVDSMKNVRTAILSSDMLEAAGVFPARVLVNRELQKEEETGRSTRHIELSLPQGKTYEAGDHLAVIGQNDDAVVDAAAAALGVSSWDVIRISLPPGKESTRHMVCPLDVPVLLRIILSRLIELQHTVTRAQLQVLAEFAQCPPEKTKLMALAQAGGEDLYTQEVLAKHLTVVEVLQKFPSVKLSLGAFIGLMPRMQPRYYSIASSALEQPDKVSVCVARVKGKTDTGREHVGVCSNYLQTVPFPDPVAKNEGDTLPVYCFVKDTGSSFRLPKDPSVPVILIGPGTGVAPFLGFLQERRQQKAGPSMLFFGCRGAADHLYKEEMEKFKESGVIEDLEVAYSREQPGKKVYVQDLLAAKGTKVWEWLDKRGAYVFVCGDAKAMAPAVRACFEKIAEKEGGLSAEGARGFVDGLIEEKRFCQDVWAGGH
uniref:NADPH--hemoprotein reductase n=1 Tax=Chromera velia CCMP2878 TaxID=1169474 RepID=A0A0G4GXH5_9ALVE|eukprot:Cvel_5365.t1-p1 / transcript=Cvel_5365.t1 / gene=Cvel_5365 / organism=Chromera_velia_CCMP2878 / gene_product=Bifunctional P-450/NADPH-P450 reductase, putative / transcript_product=Bifunctional P-450/NADPH-P450 reductase, putative / location=Cvel_scaffold249:52700-58603(+) / protein_length=1171 / sequence_SO=supercontig / SO=protein_coding / is_pseudo=false